MEVRRAFAVIALLVATLGGLPACGGNGSADGGDADGGDATGDGSCTSWPTPCVPFERRCSGSGVPQECRSDGQAWTDLADCPAAKTCDDDFGSCRCVAGEVEDETGGCVHAGVPCGEGWVRGDDGRCAPVLNECAEGLVPLFGGGCVPVGVQSSCGTGTWGDIPVDESTIYVDGSYAGGDGDGTRERPLTTIAEGIARVPMWIADLTTVAVAAGRYEEAVAVNHPANLIGVCADRVVIVPPPASTYGMTITGFPSHVTGITLDREGGREYGIGILDVEDVELTDVAVRNVVGVGIRCSNCTVTGTNVTVENVDAVDPNATGIGIGGWGTNASPCSMTLTGVDVADADNIALFPRDCDLILSQSHVSSPAGAGILAESRRRPAALRISETFVSPAVGVGIGSRLYADAATGLGVVVLERNVVRDVRIGSVPGTTTWGIGLVRPSSAGVDHNLVDGSAGGGIRVVETRATVTRNTIEDVATAGILVETPDGSTLPTTATILMNDVIGIGGGSTETVAAGEGIALVRCEAASVERNRVADGFLTAVRVDSPDSFVAGNIIDDGGLVPAGSGATTGLEVAGGVGGTATVARNVVEGVAVGISTEGVVAVIERNAIGPFAPRPGDDPSMPVVAVRAQSPSPSVFGNEIALAPAGADPRAAADGIAVLAGAWSVEGNSVARAGGVGIRLDTPAAAGILTARDNNVAACGGTGIQLRGAPTGAEVVGNRVSGSASSSGVAERADGILAMPAQG